MSNKEAEHPILPPQKSAQRLIAIDAARGLAVIGMFVQHFALNQTNQFVSGNTMVLFILCSGISYSMMARHMEECGVQLAAFRTRILARAVLIDFVGYLLILLNGPFSVVFPTYAMLFLFALLLVRRSTHVLGAMACISFLVCPPLMLLGMGLFGDVDLLRDMAGGPLSALAWAPVFITGMTLGRLNLRDKQMPICLVTIGFFVMLPTKLMTVFVLPDWQQSFGEFLLGFSDYYSAPIDPYAIWPFNTQPVPWQMLVYDAPQGGSTFELLIGTGLSLVILGLLLLVELKCAALLTPLGATGRMALTLYAGQFVLAWGLQLSGVDFLGLDLGAVPFGDLFVAVAVLVMGCLLAQLPNGPLEACVRRFERMFGHAQS